MIRSLLVRGMLVGLAAALLALVVAWIFGEPQVGHAIGFEEHQAALAGEPPEPELVSRSMQKTLGLATGIGLYGVALGGLFALAFAFAYGRIGSFGARATSALVALAGFTAVELAPFMKYPANPPSVGSPDTIGKRTALYFGLILISVLFAIAAVLIGRRLAPRLGNWNAALTAVGVFIALLGVAYLTMPTVQEVPKDFPAVVLWRFRLSSLGIQATLWTALGLLFGPLTERRLPHRSPATAATPITTA
ncbi:CbtA family protein [Actinoallomurus purpureus]|uniref:CbtA family protein n=1 Tax=Actinoallomurus purpureus TaxID=478114 RepID=UPI002091F307|nr:CbtA family protein [Actinoallomurus purpureus]MCO6005411.1 CbtA family protein [Actinoallomurus purpureus]